MTHFQEKAAFLQETTKTANFRGFNYRLQMQKLMIAFVLQCVSKSNRERSYEAQLQVQNSGLDMTNITISLPIQGVRSRGIGSLAV